MPSTALAELPHHFGFFGIAEIQAIRGGAGARAHCGDVARGFGDGMHCADARIERAPAAVAVGGKREGAMRAFEAHDGGIGRAGQDERIGAHHVIVLLEDPALGGDGGRGEQTAEIFGEVVRRRGRKRASARRARGDGGVGRSATGRS